MNKPYVINLFGAPGSGKSTGAAYIFAQLKMRNINCELVTEYAKDLTWERRELSLGCQEYIFGKQSFRMKRCRDKVDVIITDSPIPLGIFYNSDPALDEHFKQTVMNVFNTYLNNNYLIKRVKPYNPIGRNQTELESDEIGKRIRSFLDNRGIIYLEANGSPSAYDVIVKRTLKDLTDLGLYEGEKND